MASSRVDNSMLSEELRTDRTNAAGGSGRFPLTARVDQPEWLDLGYGTRTDVERNLREMNFLNRLTGGISALTVLLAPRIRGLTGPIRILDLGTGIGGAPLQLLRWARRQSIDLRLYGLDWSKRNLACAQEFLPDGTAIGLVCGDAHRLPFPEGSMDFVISSQFLHHFSPEEMAQMLQTAYRCARQGLIMTDLLRGAAPRAAFRLIAPVFARHPLTRHDGDLSIRRAYLVEELRSIARLAGLPNPLVRAHFPWRLTLVVDR